MSRPHGPTRSRGAAAPSLTLAGQAVLQVLGGIVNRSAYWVPVLIAPGGPSADADRRHRRLHAAVQLFPEGFRMIAGDSNSRVMQQRSYFDCNGQRMSQLGVCGGELRQIVEFRSAGTRST